MKANLRLPRALFLLACFLWLASSLAAEAASIKETMDEIVTRLLATMPEEKLVTLDEPAVQQFITQEERRVLATRYWCFDVNVPAVVSVMRHVEQAVTPYWLPEAGFTKTDLKVKNAEYEYEVWRKTVGAGRVELGINGFDKHRQHYFVSVGPQDPGAKIEVSNVYPDQFSVIETRLGAMIYHDWPGLVLTDVPESLRGQRLFTTIRGRAREAHLVQAFRKTPYPSSAQPDQVVLTWSEDPRTTQTIQWRTSPAVEDGVVRYREQALDDAPWTEARAARVTIEDRLVFNDRYNHRFTAALRDLKPSTTYSYSVGSATINQWSETSDFITAPDAPAPFTFVYLSDPHNSPVSGQVLAGAFERNPQTAFVTIAGDIVGTGQYRDDWDQFFGHSRDFLRQRPLLPAIGNHDAIDGLGADLYLSLFGLPANGPKQLQPERAYSITYSNALFVILDVTESLEAQTAWLEEQLAGTKAVWKFVILHFPPYAPGGGYPDIRQEWGPLFDKYHVDFVLAGHVHYYLRTYPLNAGKRVDSPAQGTIYMITIAQRGREGELRSKPDYAEVAFLPGSPFYQTFAIDGNRLITRCCSMDGSVKDEVVIQK